MRYIYGPVNSWRLGRSLGIDLISCSDKICSFDCIYCQLGDSKLDLSSTRKVFVRTQDILEEIKALGNIDIDYVTFSGMGEPTLALNLGETIKGIKAIKTLKASIAVLTNSSLIYLDDVKSDLKLADFVIFKLDTPSSDLLKLVNRPSLDIEFAKIIEGIKEFRETCTGKLALQIMFVKENMSYAEEIAKITHQINPDEVQINTPLRPCKVKPLSKEDINFIKKEFEGLNTLSVYDKTKTTQPQYIDKNSVDMRRPDLLS